MNQLVTPKKSKRNNFLKTPSITSSLTVLPSTWAMHLSIQSSHLISGPLNFQSKVLRTPSPCAASPCHRQTLAATAMRSQAPCSGHSRDCRAGHGTYQASCCRSRGCTPSKPKPQLRGTAPAHTKPVVMRSRSIDPCYLHPSICSLYSLS